MWQLQNTMLLPAGRSPFRAYALAFGRARQEIKAGCAILLRQRALAKPRSEGLDQE
jgi:hypothetical protein